MHKKLALYRAGLIAILMTLGLLPGALCFAGASETDEADVVPESQPPAGEQASEQAPDVADKPLNPDRLWLPGSYAVHWSRLRDIAELALASERCVEVLRGELAQTESTLEAPVFAVLCRDKNRKSYVNKFNGLRTESFDAALIPRPGAAVEEAEPEPEVIDTAEISATLYARCRELWEQQVALMRNLVWLSDMDSVEPVMMSELPDEGWHYEFKRKFNAENIAGVTLRYLAVCEGAKVFELESRIDIRTDN